MEQPLIGGAQFTESRFSQIMFDKFDGKNCSESKLKSDSRIGRKV